MRGNSQPLLDQKHPIPFLPRNKVYPPAPARLHDCRRGLMHIKRAINILAAVIYVRRTNDLAKRLLFREGGRKADVAWRTVGRTDGRMDGRTVGWTDGRTDYFQAADNCWVLANAEPAAVGGHAVAGGDLIRPTDGRTDRSPVDGRIEVLPLNYFKSTFGHRYLENRAFSKH